MSLNEAALASGKLISAKTIAPAERHAVTRTPDLNDALVECATPMRRVRPPLVRAGLWLGFAGTSSALSLLQEGLTASQCSTE
jgi:hypothetical protein